MPDGYHSLRQTSQLGRELCIRARWGEFALVMEFFEWKGKRTAIFSYELNGDVERICDETARWSGTIPKCQKKKCDSLEIFHGGGIVRLLNDTAEFGNEIQYECLSGWKLMGEERRRCQHDGTWSGETPYCKGPEARD
ncbi:sushi domain protein [Cooperia oncophora]